MADGEQRPVIGMFMGGAGLADTMLYCRDKIYPLGLPTVFAHVLTAAAFLMKVFLGMKAGFLPPDPKPLQVSVHENGGTITGRFSFSRRDYARETADHQSIRRTAVGLAQAACDRATAVIDDRCDFCASQRQAWPISSARRAFRGSRRNHYRERQLQHHSRRRDVPRRARTADSSC